ncbi:MAG: hypothetical protein SF053_07180 [Bacteroidia bacterium]|nr:hypothetical protein [Bacteroidia bacterium]
MRMRINLSHLCTFLVVFLLIQLAIPVRAQVSVGDSAIRMGFLEVSYRGGLPWGDLRQRSGFLSAIGLEGGWKTKSGLYLATGIHTLFADSVALEGALDPILTSGGLIVTNNGMVTDPNPILTGIMAPLKAGWLFPIGPNPNSGLYAELGGQFFMHRITYRLQGDDVTQLQQPYRKGYDRLTFGPGLVGGAGYRFFSDDGTINFCVGFEVSQNATRIRRWVDFSTGQTSFPLRQDIFSAFRVSWTFPLYRRSPNKVYYY